MPDEIQKCSFVSTPNKAPNPFFKACGDAEHQFRQEYLGEFVEPEPEPPKNIIGWRLYRGEVKCEASINY